MKNSAEGLEPRRECCWDCVSIYENTPEKVRHLPPKNCCNYLVVQGRVQWLMRTCPCTVTYNMSSRRAYSWHIQENLTCALNSKSALRLMYIHTCSFWQDKSIWHVYVYTYMLTHYQYCRRPGWEWFQYSHSTSIFWQSDQQHCLADECLEQQSQGNRRT